MNWQRIDEDTYIDDTLVTCAEYQLFIDEMREQGKYYQPDHWVSYQFPAGQARDAILGVRHLNAIAFGDWLTQRDVGEWKFRLPTQEEAKNFPIQHSKQNSIGYWTDGVFQFSWVGPAPENTRKTAKDITIDLTVEVSVDRAHELTPTLDSALGHARVRANDRPLDISRTLTQAYALAGDRINIAKDFDRILKHILSPSLNPVDYLALDLILAEEQALSLARILTSYPEYTSKRSLEFGSLSDYSPDKALDLSLDIVIDIITFQERIAGRSPAFEGIRLVKERIR